MTSRAIPVRRSLAVTLALWAALVPVATACKRGPGGRLPADGARDEPPPDRPFREATPREQELVANAMARIATSDGAEFAQVARTLVAAGERAVPALLEALAHRDADVRSRAAYVLGFVKDRRAVEPLAAAATADPERAVRCDAGAALLEMGDVRGFVPLVDGLEDVDARRRVRCIDALGERTSGQSFGFEADGPPAERAAAVACWRSWLEMRLAEARPPSAAGAPGADDADGAATPSAPDAAPAPAAAGAGRGRAR